MKSRSTLTAGAIISAAFGILIGILVKNLPNHFSLSDLIGVIFVVFGVFTLISAIPEFFIAASSLSSLGGKLMLVSASLGIASGLILIFYHNRIIIPIIAAYLVILPIFEIICSRPKEFRASKAKALLPKIIIGALLIAFFPAASGFADTVFAVILNIIGWIIIGASIIILVLTLVSLYAKKQKKDKNDGTIYLDDEDFNDKNN